MDKTDGKQEILEYFKEVKPLDGILDGIRKDWDSASYDLCHLSVKFTGFCKKNMSLGERFEALIQAAVELTTQEAPDWEYIGARLLMLRFETRLKEELDRRKIGSFYDKICFLTEDGLYGDYILKNYKKEEIDRYEAYMDQSRNHLFNYSGLELLLNRYVIRSRQNAPLEMPQEMFLGIAMHLAMLEKDDRDTWVKRFYDMLSTLKVTMQPPPFQTPESLTISFPPVLLIRFRTAWMAFTGALTALQRSVSSGEAWAFILERSAPQGVRSAALRELQEV